MGPMAHAGSLPLSHRCLGARLCLPRQGLFPAGEGDTAGDTWAPPGRLSELAVGEARQHPQRWKYHFPRGNNSSGELLFNDYVSVSF